MKMPTFFLKKNIFNSISHTSAPKEQHRSRLISGRNDSFPVQIVSAGARQTFDCQFVDSQTAEQTLYDLQEEKEGEVQV